MKPYKSKLIVVIQNVLLQKYYLDIFYEKIIVKNIMYKNIIGLLNYIDTKFIDGTWDRIAITTKTISSRLSFIQNGQLQFYSFGIPLGIIIMSFLVILWR
jgi:NADH:ubiquinone oxidoreductase subunit 5 (subunit L)/multisubunit Na+/H+ antiporter MnhA subunit